jgi:hypothetical protein
MTALEPVERATRWRTNGELIADVARLGYLRQEWLTLDPTFGEGTWWSTWRPFRLVTHHHPTDGVDFRHLPHGDGVFDAVAFDPPYVARGGRKTAGVELRSTNERYGLNDCPATPELLQALINDGLAEMVRVVRPGGNVLVKCQDYVSSGQLFPGTIFTFDHARSLGLRLEDIFDMVTTPRPQPHGRQVRVRSNTSRLYVFRKPGRK